MQNKHFFPFWESQLWGGGGHFFWLLLSQNTRGLTFLKEDTTILAHKNILNHTHQAWNTSILIAMHG